MQSLKNIHGWAQMKEPLSYALEILSRVVGIMGGCLGFLHTPIVDCCNAQLQNP